MRLLIVMLLSIAVSAGAQTSTTFIDYYNWTGASGCNIFSSATSVPASLNSSSTTVTHLSTVGQPQYDNTNQAVELPCDGNSGVKGSEFRLAYDFHAGSSYRVTVVAAGVGSSGQPYLRLNIGNSTGGSTSCSGAATIDGSLSGGLITNRLMTGSFTTYNLDYSTFSSGNPYITFAAIPQSGSSGSVLIKSITIIETYHPAFTITPTSVSVPCGSVNPVTFTVNNVYSTPGSVTYNWNLGSSGNGWLYGGSPATTFSTSTNSISLTPSSSATTLTNVSVTPAMFGSNTATLTSNVSISSDVEISGSLNGLCSSAGNRVFSVPNYPSGTYSWTTSSSLAISGSTTSYVANVYSVSDDANAWVEVAVTTPCTSGTITRRVYLVSGFPYFSALGVGPTGPDTAAPYSYFHYYFDVPFGYPAAYYYWRVPSGWTIVSGQGTDNLYVQTGALGSGGSVQCDVTACDLTRYTYIYTVVDYGGSWIPDAKAPGAPKTQQGKVTPEGSSGITDNALTLTPNPARDQVVVTLNRQLPALARVNVGYIREVRLINGAGAVAKRMSFSNNLPSQRIAVNNITSGIYVVSVFDGKRWYNQKLIISR